MSTQTMSTQTIDRKPAATSPPQPALALPSTWLVARLAAALSEAGVSYCQWKGHGKTARWAVGAGDIDLLVDRTAAPRFTAVLERLGFKLAVPPGDYDVPGVASYLGFDPAVGHLIHVHAHFQLVIGRAWTTHFRLPLERAVLDSAVEGQPFRAPSPTLDLLLLVLRATVAHDWRDAFHRREPGWIRRLQPELEQLRKEAPLPALIHALTCQLPEVDVACLERCCDALRPGYAPWRRVTARLALERRLRPYAHRPPAPALLRRVGRLAQRLAGVRREPAPGNKRLVSGGALIALVGADGAGKSTCARSLDAWLGTVLDTRHAHLGRPPRSLTTLAVAGMTRLTRWLDALRRRAVPSSLRAHCELLGCACTARDRYRLYRRMRRFATAGGLALCERYPLPENRALVGPSEAQGFCTALQSRLAAWLRRAERAYYARITPPDLVLVLKVDPDTAARRKTNEPEGYVRARAGLLWNTEWTSCGAQIVDARRPLTAVTADLQARIWSAL